MSQASIRSEVISLQGRGGSLQLAWSGTPTGTSVTIYAGNTHDPRKSGVDKWNGAWDSVNALISPAPAVPAGSSGSQFINLDGLRAGYIYVEYVRSAGSGALSGGVQVPEAGA